MTVPALPNDKAHFIRIKDLVRLEEAQESEEIREEFLQLQPQERQLRGKALLNLSLVERHFSPAEHLLATLCRPNREPLPLFTLETGDIVSVFPHKQKFSECPVGTVYEKTHDTITIAFNKPLPEWFSDDKLYDLHKSINQVTYRRMLEALDGVYETQNTDLAHLRDLSLGLAKTRPAADKDLPTEWLDEGLNDSQRLAVRKCLVSRDLCLVHGPPGTGKTTVLIEIIRQCVRRGESVFVTAPSNTACDNILERLIDQGLNAVRLGHPARIVAALREHTLDFKLALHPLSQEATRLQAALYRLLKRETRYDERRRPSREEERKLEQEIHLKKQEIRSIRREVYERVIKEAEVFIGTPTNVMDRSIRDRVFDLLVFDEATQATEPLSWIPMSMARRIVMAGDHFQLPPTVRSKEAEQRGLGVTLFERFHAILPESHRQLLDRQYRMNDKIMGFSSRMFYGGLLVADDSVRDGVLADLDGVRRSAETEEPLLFLDTAGKGFEEKLEEGSQSRYNPEEAALVLGQLRLLLEHGVPPQEIAVIGPYSAQVRLLASQSPDPRIEVDSVDGFQGREKELVIVSLVRSNTEGEMGFLTDTRRMNVAMTRARKKLIVIGDSSTLSVIPFYRDFIQYAQDRGAYKTVWELESAAS